MKRKSTVTAIDGDKKIRVTVETITGRYSLGRDESAKLHSAVVDASMQTLMCAPYFHANLSTMVLK